MILIGLALVSCATVSPIGTTRSQHIVRLKTCLQEIGKVDPGPLNDNATDGQMTAALHAYFAEFSRSDMMGMGRDPSSQEVQHDATRALLLNGWRDGKLSADDPLAKHPFQPVQF